MKIRDLDYADTPINQEHTALGLPPLERIPLHPVIRGAVVFAILPCWVYWRWGRRNYLAAVGSRVWILFAPPLMIRCFGMHCWWAYWHKLLMVLWVWPMGLLPPVFIGYWSLASLGHRLSAYGGSFTTGVSGISTRNSAMWIKIIFAFINTRHYRRCVGAVLVTQVDGKTLKPFITVYLLLMGIYVLSKAFRKHLAARQGEPKHVAKLALLGGFVDTSGGGGWGRWLLLLWWAQGMIRARL